eukprot:gene6494-9367_t
MSTHLLLPSALLWCMRLYAAAVAAPVHVVARNADFAHFGCTSMQNFYYLLRIIIFLPLVVECCWCRSESSTVAGELVVAPQFSCSSSSSSSSSTSVVVGEVADDVVDDGEVDDVLVIVPNSHGSSRVAVVTWWLSLFV